MAIQNRRGQYADFDPSKAVAGELLTVLNGDPKAKDGKAVYMAFASGDVKRLATYEDMLDNIENASEEIAEQITEEVEADVSDSVQAAQTAATTATTKASEAAASAASVSASASQIATNTSDITDLKSAFNGLFFSETLYKGSHAYAGGAENWTTTFIPATAMDITIRFTGLENHSIEIAELYNNSWNVVATINDTKWHIVHLPSGSSDRLILTYRGSDAITIGVTIFDASDDTIIDDIGEIKRDAEELHTLLSTAVTYPHRGFINTSGNVVANPNFYYSDYIDAKNLDKNVDIYWHSAVATFTFYDANKTYLNEYVKRTEPGAGVAEKTITIPNDAVYVIVCTDPTFDNKVYEWIDIKSIKQDVQGTNESYGNNGETTTYYSTRAYSYCPCKKADKGGKLTEIYLKCDADATLTLYVGEVDQLYLFVPRQSFTVNVSAGEQFIDISDKNIYINEGEQLLVQNVANTPLDTIAGEPEGEKSFYYSIGSSMQLQVYGANKSIVFGLGYTVEVSKDNAQNALIAKNEESINVLNDNVAYLQSNFNIVSDIDGNKYRMIVRNGALALLAMNFRNVLCVGNSYTTHPTTTDTEPDYANNLWWGHWAMAASTRGTAWTSLLQAALRQKINDAVVTPVFGRRYETAPSTYDLNNSNTFTYWDGTAWKSLKDNIASFGNVDAIVFFLGANYSGNDWYTLYNAMVEKFLEWFPNASLFCCSSTYWDAGAKDVAIQTVASEQLATYISMVGVGNTSRIGSYVKGDDNNLHQINNSAVANHFGDYGEYLILDRICSAMGYANNTELYDISITAVSGVTLTVKSSKLMSGAVVSVFADIASGITLSSITVKDASNNSITVTDHGTTDYGRVFTFTMPSSDVTVTAVTA